jgi:hypothetical protein
VTFREALALIIWLYQADHLEKGDPLTIQNKPLITALYALLKTTPEEKK